MVAQTVDLVHAVRHDQDTRSLLALLPQNRKQRLDLIVVQRRRHLVEQEELRRVCQRLRNLYHALLRRRNVLHERFGTAFDLQPVKQCANLLALPAAVDQSCLSA